MRELKDRYEVKAFLPDAKASEANVKLEGNRLEVTVTHRQQGDAGEHKCPQRGDRMGTLHAGGGVSREPQERKDEGGAEGS